MNARTNLPLGVVYGMPMEEYQSIDALSATGLRLFSRSPWHYKNRVPVAATRPMLRGNLAHCAQLEPDALAQRYIVTPEDAPKRPTPAQWAAKKSNESSTYAKEWWSNFAVLVALREVVSFEEYSITQQQLLALGRDQDIASTLASGAPEVSVFWVDEDTGVYCKARPDWVHQVDGNQVDLMDLKTTADESPNGFGRVAAKMRYHLQRAHYTAGYECAADIKVRQFIFAAVTNALPVLAVPYILTDEIDQQAIDERGELLERFAWCKREDQWPTYGRGLQLLDFPAYAKRSSEVEVEWSES